MHHKIHTTEDHAVWKLLFERQMQILPGKACHAFLEGIKRIGFHRDEILAHTEISRRLMDLTGWQLYAVPGIVANHAFFEALSRRHFPATEWLRTMQQLNYLEEPDMFHDVFGHVPLLSNPAFCGFLEGLSHIALRNIANEVIIEKIARMYWYTVEFGLIMEGDRHRIYGAGILSSGGETEFCLGPQPERKRFDAEEILETPYFTDRYQETYFVITSFDELFDSLPTIERVLSKRQIPMTI